MNRTLKLCITFAFLFLTSLTQASYKRKFFKAGIKILKRMQSGKAFCKIRVRKVVDGRTISCDDCIYGARRKNLKPFSGACGTFACKQRKGEIEEEVYIEMQNEDGTVYYIEDPFSDDSFL